VKAGFLAITAVAIVAASTQSAIANTVKTIAASQVTGSNAQLQTVKVWSGHGVSISFYNTGEIIKKIWLDDPSQFVIDVDGCLEGLGRNCSQPGAGLIHIRKIESIKIPSLPKAAYGAHLTVITATGSSHKSYHFRIVSGSGAPEYSQLEIIRDALSPRNVSEAERSSRNPNNPTINRSFGRSTQEGSAHFLRVRPREPISNKPQVETKPKADYTATSDSRYIARGMHIALERKLINTNDALWERLNNLVQLRSQGQEVEIAAIQAGVSMQLVEKLMLLGGKRYISPNPITQTRQIKPTPARQNNILVDAENKK
jgi:hypothetical protein